MAGGRAGTKSVAAAVTTTATTVATHQACLLIRQPVLAASALTVSQSCIDAFLPRGSNTVGRLKGAIVELRAGHRGHRVLPHIHMAKCISKCVEHWKAASDAAGPI